MAITNKQILQKIIEECELALGNEKRVREHAKAIQSLTDLLLEEETAAVPSVDDIEWEKMVGGNKQQSKTVNHSKKLVEEDANGDSLFDF